MIGSNILFLMNKIEILKWEFDSVVNFVLFFASCAWYCIYILILKSASSVVSLTVLSFSDRCKLLGKELGRGWLLPHRSRGQWVWDWDICYRRVGQDHDGGHAQPSSPSPPTHLETRQTMKPHRDLCFLAGWVSELQHIPLPTKLAGTDRELTPEPLNPLFFFILYFTLGIKISPLLIHHPTLSVTQGLWHQKTKLSYSSYVALQSRHLRYLLIQKPHFPESSF